MLSYLFGQNQTFVFPLVPLLAYLRRLESPIEIERTVYYHSGGQLDSSFEGGQSRRRTGSSSVFVSRPVATSIHRN
jgi:hypothetical protein